jgi:hypothetical protein
MKDVLYEDSQLELHAVFCWEASVKFKVTEVWLIAVLAGEFTTF